MDLSYTDEQAAWRQRAIDFAQAELNHEILEREGRGEFSHDDWRTCAEFGIQGLLIDPVYGGQGLDVTTAVITLEGLGYGCRDNGLPFALASQMFSLQTIIDKVGTDEQKLQYLPGLCAGTSIGAFAITEEETGSDAFGLRCRAERTDGGWILNGRKSYITLAPVCDHAVVFATVDPDKRHWGVTAFIVDDSMPGFSTTTPRPKMGMQITPMGDVLLEDCFVPDSHVLGGVGAGAALFTKTMEAERGYIYACQLGAMQRQLEDAVEYANTRRYTSGTSIGHFQSVTNRLADMKLRLETSRYLLYRVAWLEDTGQPLLMEAAMAKLYLSECFVESSLDSIRTFGARGYVAEFEVERDLRDSIGGLVYSGTSDIQRNIIARLLGVKGA